MGYFLIERPDYIGKGIVFPITLVNGKPQIEMGKELIKGSIRNILAFSIGTRFMLGEFGTRVEDLLEEPNTESLGDFINYILTEALDKWEKRIEVQSIEVSSTMTSCLIQINYYIINAKTEDFLIWPFY